MTILRLEGRIEREVAALLGEQLAGFDPSEAPVEIDLHDADIEDGVVTAMLVDAIREAAARIGPVVVAHAPQVLAHALYRVGAVGEGSRVDLREPREELGRSS